MNVIYGLHLGDRRYRYIGLTTLGANNRLQRHLAEARYSNKKSAVYSWISKYSDSVQVEIIEQCESRSDLATREIYWISKMASDGYSLLNLTLGGEGVSGYRHTEEFKFWMADRMRNNTYRRGSTVSIETREKMSRSHIGQQNCLGLKASEATKLLISESLKGNQRALGLKHSDETKSRISTGARKFNHTRWHTQRSISKPETCIFCQEESYND